MRENLRGSRENLKHKICSKEIADASEKQVVDSNEIYKQMKGKYEELQASTNATQKSLKDQIGKLESSKAELEEKATAGK